MYTYTYTHTYKMYVYVCMCICGSIHDMCIYYGIYSCIWHIYMYVVKCTYILLCMCIHKAYMYTVYNNIYVYDICACVWDINVDITICIYGIYMYAICYDVLCHMPYAICDTHMPYAIHIPAQHTPSPSIPDPTTQGR